MKRNVGLVILSLLFCAVQIDAGDAAEITQLETRVEAQAQVVVACRNIIKELGAAMDAIAGALGRNEFVFHDAGLNDLNVLKNNSDAIVENVKALQAQHSNAAPKNIPYNGLLQKGFGKKTGTIFAHRVINNPLADALVLETVGQTTRYALKTTGMDEKKAAFCGHAAKTLLHLYCGHGNFGTKATTIAASFLFTTLKNGVEALL